MKVSKKESDARYRAKRKAAGKSISGTPGYKSKWDRAEFIALDGEGESIGEAEIFNVPNGGKTYHAKEHFYTLLAASSGDSLFNGGKRLNSQCCIDFLLDLSDAHRNAIFVIFAGSYDINHMLLFGFDKEFLQQISKGETVRWKTLGVEYELEYRARKSLTLRRGRVWKKNSLGKWVCNYTSKITVWDVFGFFQESFVGVMKKWLGENHRHYALIKRMKEKRGDFANVPQAEINAYNAAELEALVEIMQKVRDAIDGLGLKCSRWDGAGAIAAALMAKHKIKDFKRQTPDDLIEAVRTAYAGGRIEVCKIGNHDDAIYDYDINSAYPSVMQSLPCLAHGCWSHTGKSSHILPGFTLCRARFKFKAGLPFYPLFYRNENMQICFPSEGEGIYWRPEIEAALKCPTDEFEVIEQWNFKPQCNHGPFHWIEDYYKTRQAWVKNPTEDWQRGAEKIIKLGLNSLYGKTAQQLGGSNVRQPAYHQLEWAGYITSAIRAKLFEAAQSSPDSIIAFATDGIFSTDKLDIKVSENKTLGEWDLKIFAGLTIAMAGVYWLHEKETLQFYANDKLKIDEKIKYNHFSRGFDKDAMKTPSPIVDAWKKGGDSIDILMHRLIGMGSACASETFWQMRGRFTDGQRTLKINGDSHKRAEINVKKTKPWQRLVNVAPNLNIDYAYGAQGCSHPYPVLWLRPEELEKELELERENTDTENI